MPSFVNSAFIQSLYGASFFQFVGSTPPTLIEVGLLDPNGDELGLPFPSYARVDAGIGTNWEGYQLAEDCGGNSSSTTNQSGARNVNAIDFGIVGAGESWPVRYVGVYGDGTLTFRVDLGATFTFNAGDGVVIPAGELRVGSEYAVI